LDDHKTDTIVQEVYAANNPKAKTAQRREIPPNGATIAISNATTARAKAGGDQAPTKYPPSKLPIHAASDATAPRATVGYNRSRALDTVALLLDIRNR
jgi:hypothetical protein